MNYWFGDPWPQAEYRAPVCQDDLFRAPTPTDVDCVMCGERIVEGDRGTSLGVVRMPGYVTETGWMHAECSLRSVVGNVAHVSGQCQHTGQCNEIEADKSYRQQSLDVWAYMNRVKGW